MREIVFAESILGVICFILFVSFFMGDKVTISLWFFEVGFAAIISAAIILCVTSDKEEDE